VHQAVTCGDVTEAPTTKPAVTRASGQSTDPGAIAWNPQLVR